MEERSAVMRMKWKPVARLSMNDRCDQMCAREGACVCVCKGLARAIPIELAREGERGREGVSFVDFTQTVRFVL